MRLRYSYPQHRCPHLVSTPDAFLAPPSQPLSAAGLTPAHQRVLNTLRKGARILLDLSKGKAMVYRMRQGIEQVMVLTVRTLSTLVRQGVLVISERHGQWVHYTYAHPGAVARPTP